VTNWDNQAGTTVTKLQPTAAGATVLGPYLTGGLGPFGIAFDGANMWIANQQSASVSKM
jgi:hypothetical protein